MEAKGLKIGTGLKAIPIKDDFDEVRGTFKFAPGDSMAYSKLKVIVREIEKKQKEINAMIEEEKSDDEILEETNLLIQYMIDSIDNLYGKGSSNILFGESHDSIIMFEDFFNGIIPFYEEYRQQRVNKYTGKYKGGK